MSHGPSVRCGRRSAERASTAYPARPYNGTAMPTVTSPGTRVIDETEIEPEKPYYLILLDDDHHTYEYVVRMLERIFGYSREKGFAIACMVDSEGRAILMTGTHAEAEAKQSQVHAFGADPLMADSLGSMSAVIEPAA